MADVDVPTIYDSISVSEDVALFLPSVNQSDSVTVEDVNTVTFQMDIREDPRSAFKMKLPTWRLFPGGSFSPVFYDRQLNDVGLNKWGGYSGLGYFGSRLSETIPLADLSGSMFVADVGMSSDTNIPVRSGSGRFGWRLAGYAPTRSFSASLLNDYYLILDKRIPVRSLTGKFKYPSSFTLSRQIPLWVGSVSLVFSQEVGASAVVRIPGAFIFSGSGRALGTFSLDKNTPIRSIESDMYCISMVLDEKIPVWLSDIDAAAITTMTDTVRFTDYILRYTRP